MYEIRLNTKLIQIVICPNSTHLLLIDLFYDLLNRMKYDFKLAGGRFLSLELLNEQNEYLYYSFYSFSPFIALGAINTHVLL